MMSHHHIHVRAAEEQGFVSIVMERVIQHIQENLFVEYVMAQEDVKVVMEKGNIKI